MKKFIYFFLVISFYQLTTMEPQRPVVISKQEGQQGPQKRKYITYSLQSSKTKEFPYKYITHYPDRDNYEITGDLVSDTESEVYRKIPKQEAEDAFYRYQLEAEHKDKAK